MATFMFCLCGGCAVVGIVMLGFTICKGLWALIPVWLIQIGLSVFLALIWAAKL